MAKERLSMRKIKEVLRLHFEHQQSARQIAQSCDIARSTVKEYLHRAEQAKVIWPLSGEMDDAALENRLFPPAPLISPEKRQMPPMEYLHQERKKKGVTLQLLWHEYKETNPDGYQYSQFCEIYRQWTQKLDVCLRQEYRAGEKLFVDYAGQTIPIQDPLTGVIREAYLFVATLGASNYTFVEATLSQDLPSWIQSHVHAFEFFQGVAEILIPDNLKTGVTHPCRYEPDINPTYLDLAEYYNTVVIPARVRKAKDKAKVESAVLIAERWILAALRNRIFFSLEELNEAIREKLQGFNLRKFQKLETTRKELFENLDRPALKPLPEKPYEYAEWKKATVNIDYHIEVDHHYYSVPYQLTREQVEVRITLTTIEVLFKNRRVASHARSYRKGAFTTLKEHMPKAHQQYLEWTPSRIIRWAAQIGPHTEELITQILERKPHPQQGFRSCLGIIRLKKLYSQERLEAACAYAISIQGFSYKSVQSILKNRLDQKHTLLPTREESTLLLPLPHPNIRGKEYYQ
ncbi:MAG: IS21 family transposase [Deltaproteobacteria bacterium]|nr:IS21 family transposase [Deltaproteobacteria bacterium]